MKSCLIVDDSKVIRKVARRILEEFDFDVREAADGQDAIDLCVEEMPGSVLLDWNMPVKNGLEFLKELRRAKGGSKTKVVFVPLKMTWLTFRWLWMRVPTNTL